MTKETRRRLAEHYMKLTDEQKAKQEGYKKYFEEFKDELMPTKSKKEK